MLAPLTGPAVWSASELQTRSEWTQVLRPDERAELVASAAEWEGGDGAPVLLGRALEETSAADFPLSALTERVCRIRDQLETGAGAVRLRGLPIDGISANQARVMFWVLAVHLGTPVSQSPLGERLFSVRDAGFDRDDPRARGPNTSRQLSFHTDRSDVVGFLCLQEAREGGRNEIASSMAVYNQILAARPDLLKELLQPLYYLRHTVDMANDRPWCQQPVFSFRDGHFAGCVLRVLIERAHSHPDLPDLTARQIEALDMVESVAAQPRLRVQFSQAPGDLLWINNWVVLHKRQEFTDWPEPARKRHILRVWVSPSNSRPIDPSFLDNYGSVDAGVVRGGMRASTGIESGARRRSQKNRNE